MSEAERERRDVAASSAEAPRSGWRSWFASTGQPPAWGLVRYMVCGLFLGAALGAALPQARGTLLAALAGVIVSAAGAAGPSGISRRLALIAAALGLVLTVVAFATGNHPLWAGLAMGAVALLTSLMAAAGPLGGILGFLLSLGYMLVATMARVANLFELVSVRWAAAHIAAGCVGGLLVVFVGTAWRRRSEPDEVKAATAPLPVGAMWASLRSFDEHARDGVRRAIPLAVLMYLFQLNGGRDAFWIFFAAYLVLLTPGKNPKSLALSRVGGTLFGVVLLAVISLVVPDRVLFSFGIVILFSGIGLSPTYPIIAGGLTTMGSVLLAGAPTGAVGNWAERRLLDTVVGCAVALIATYLFWPRDREAEEPVPVPST
jgi:Fusaric acid resistance protein-like